MQVFDVRNASVIKMDLIDFGEFPAAVGGSRSRRVFFVGRLIVDGDGNDTYVNVFTVVFQ
mgnify:FL=1